jgi:hypothetical protein
MAVLKRVQIVVGGAMEAARGLICMTMFVLMTTLQASPSTPTEYDIKAVFMLNFTRFIEWPVIDGLPANQPLVIGVIGEDPFGHRLDEVIRGEKVNNRSVVVKRLAQLDGGIGCTAVFISRSEKPRLAPILQRLKGWPVLTVSDIPEFAQQGGMVELVSEKGKIRLHINVDEAKAAHLAISSKLLRPAQIVSTRKTSGVGFSSKTGLLASSTRP